MRRTSKLTTGLAGAFGIACLLSAGVIRAEEHEDAGTRDVQVQMPEFLEQLELTDEQRARMKEAVREHNQKLASHWAQFHALHMRALRLEAAMLAAIEDPMTEEQREQFRQALRMRLQARRHHAARIDVEERDRLAPPERSQRPEPPMEAEEPRQLQPPPDQSDAPPPREELREREEQAGEPKQVRRGVLIVGIAVGAPQEHLETTELSDEERSRLDDVCAAYQAHLQSLWGRIQALHLEMVQAEADKLATIEHILTEEQLEQLRDLRRHPPEHQVEVFIEEDATENDAIEEDAATDDEDE